MLRCARRRVVRDNAPQLGLIYGWLDSWSGTGLIVAGMTHEGWDLQLTAYAARDWRANFFPVGSHTIVAARRGKPTPWALTPPCRCGPAENGLSTFG